MLKGYSTPLSPRGSANLVPPPPWYYVGDVLTIDFWADPAAVAAHLPPGVEPARDDPGRCAAFFCDWQSCSEDRAELLDPVRAQYHEFFVLVNGSLDGAPVTVCPYIFVDQDVSLVRGLIQGFPKQFGSIHLTRAFPLASAAAPVLGPGGTFGATVAVKDRRLVDATVTLRAISPAGSQHAAAPMLNVRYFPRLAAGRHGEPAVHELVRSKMEDKRFSEFWMGDATLRFHESPTQELHDLAPVRVGPGFKYVWSFSVKDLEDVRDLRTHK